MPVVQCISAFCSILFQDGLKVNCQNVWLLFLEFQVKDKKFFGSLQCVFIFSAGKKKTTKTPSKIDTDSQEGQTTTTKTK